MRNLLAEKLLNPLRRREGVLDHVVQKAGRNGHDIQLHVRQRVRNLEGMHKVGLARVTHLPLVLER